MIGGHELNRTFAVWRPFTDDDGAGGYEVTMAEVGTVRARVSQPSAAERVAAMQAGAELITVIYLAPDADVVRGDELREGDEAYRVKATIRPSEVEYLRADCERVQAEPEDEGT